MKLRALVAAALLAAAIVAVVLLQRDQSGQGSANAVHCPKVNGSTPSVAAPKQATGVAAEVQVRVNQVGYAAGCEKQALVMSRRPLAGQGFLIRDASSSSVKLRAQLGPSGKPWSAAWPYVYAADFSQLVKPGAYVISVAGAASPAFRIDQARALYRPLTANAVRFFQAQRDGSRQLPGPMSRSPSHLLDAHAAVYGRPAYRGLLLQGSLKSTGGSINAEGGWFDAGDYLKFVETSSFDDVLMLTSLRDYSRGVSDRRTLATEARFGVDWLLKMWDSRRRVLYYQVGIGDGNGGSVLGDHDLWRLPQSDDAQAPSAKRRSATYFISHRPAFAANTPGGPISPNLAGRVAAAFALCAQVFASEDRAYAQRCEREGRAVYALADTHPHGELLTTSPHAYYGEREYRDDLALGAIELYLGSRALREPRPDYADLTRAGRWIDDYISSSTNGRDSLNLFDLSALASFDIARELRRIGYPTKQTLPLNIATDPNAIIADQRDQLNQAAKLSDATSFGLANPATNEDTVPHALGYAVQARLYDLLTGSTRFEALAATQLDWVLGRNPWGSSFVVSAGTTFPHCLAHQIANLSGSLTGSGRILAGAVVDGPNDPASLHSLGAPDGYRPCQAGTFGVFDPPQFGYVDDARSPTTSEPSDDYVALSLLAFAQQG